MKLKDLKAPQLTIIPDGTNPTSVIEQVRGMFRAIWAETQVIIDEIKKQGASGDVNLLNALEYVKMTLGQIISGINTKCITVDEPPSV